MTDQIRLLLLFLCNGTHFLLIQAIVFECRSTEPCGCSLNHVDIDSRIIGGETVAYRSWGWAVSIRNSYHVHICGGTILSKQFVLTAAHCFRRAPKDYFPYSIVIGIDSLFSTTGQIRIVSEIILHPKWNFTTKENDIALLQLTTPISMDDINIAQICLPEVTKLQQIRYPKLNSSLVAIGWGITTWEDLISPMYLRQVTLQTIDTTESKCKTIIKNVNVQFCAAVKGGGEKDTCQGDSGGPIMHFSTKKRRWILTGIISYGYRCALRDYTGVYTRISVYLNWIKLIIGSDGLVTVEESQAIIHQPSNVMIVLLFTLISFSSRTNCLENICNLFVT